MASTVSIANRALTKLGADRILLLSDDNQQARVMNSMFNDVRDEEMARNHWKFAMRRATLTALVDQPLFGYQYQYPLPPDYLGIVQVGEIYARSCPRGRAPWSIENNGTGLVLMTDRPAPLNIRYIARIENVGLWHPLFCETMACKLALEGAEPLTQSSTKKSAAADEYRFALAEARRVDAIENPPDDVPWGSWLDSRMGPGPWGSGDDWQAFTSGTAT